MKLRTLYLLLAVFGAVIPFVFFLQYFQSAGFALPDFVAALFVNGATGGFTADLLISSVVFWLAMYHERRRGSGPSPLLFVLLNLCVGLSCALPAWLYAREARVTN